MRNVRLFVSSPGDVAIERQRVQWIADRLSGEFMQSVRFETILWETAVFNAHEGGFQPQIDERARPADCDLVLAIFWGRLGTELPASFPDRMADGSPYPSGTAYEVLTALEARKANEHRPDVFVFRKNVIPTVPINDRAARDEADRQWERLEDFFGRYFELADKRILRVVEKFREISEFEQKVERLLRDWIKSNVSQGTIWSIEEKGSPFRGLEPFDARHADVYCGRDRKVLRAIDELLNAARRGKPFLLIPGASGSGKSSLMRAGLAPRIVRPGAVAGVDLWRVAVMRPATDGNPMLALARALFVAGDAKKDDPGGFGSALPELALGAFKTPERLAQLFAGAAAVAVDPVVAALDHVAHEETRRRSFERPLTASLLLLVDQLEDIFTASVKPEERADFANLLAAFVNTQRIWVIATLRGDMYERVITERPFIALKDIGGQFDLGPPGPDELDEIVHRSAEAAGLSYEERVLTDAPGSERRERLDDRLLRDAAGENTLPLLQFALNLLFEKCCVGRQSKVLTIAAYEEIGGLDGSIHQTAETALARLVRPDSHVKFPLEKEVEEEIARSIDPRLEALLRKLVVPVAQESQGAEAAADRALTARIVPIAEARRDEPTGRLIDALLAARILFAPRSAHGSWLRIAHDRVITSWHRARDITEKHRDFYRVKESIEHHRRRWDESRQSVEFLIPAGAPITQAEEKVEQFADEFSEASRHFVAVSSRRARFRQRLTTAATLVFAVVAVIATGLSYYASVQRQRATRNYEAARGTVGRLVTSIAEKLRDLDGISVGTVEQALNQVVALVDNLEEQSGGDPELQRIHATMHFEFARVFQNTRDLPRALREAEAGLRIRDKLTRLPAARDDWRSDQAQSLDQAGDIHRVLAIQLERARDPRAADEYGASRKLFDQAHAIRARLHDEDQDNPAWASGLSQSLVRLGDHKVRPANDLAGAKADYQQALELIVKVVRREPEKESWQRELSWGLNKVGDILVLEDDLPGGLAMYEKALCTRRYIADCDPMNTLCKRDLAFSLERISDARFKARDFPAAEESLFEALLVRRELIERDPFHTLWMRELGATLHRIGVYLRETENLELAAGFFQMAAEIRRQVAHRVAVDDLAAESTAECDKAIERLGSAEGSTAPDLKLLKEQLKHLATKKEAEMERRIQQLQFDPVACWSDLKASLQQSAAVQQAERN